MIIIAVVFVIITLAEMKFLKKKEQSLKPYFIIITMLFIISEVLFYFRDTFQIAMLVELFTIQKL